VLLDVVYNHFGPSGNYIPAFAKAFHTQRHKTDWGDAINFDLYYGGKSALEPAGENPETHLPPVTEETPQFRDIHIAHLICRGAKRAIVLQGLPEMPLRDLTLNDVSITSQQGVQVTDAENVSFENVRVDQRTGEALKTVRVQNSRLDLTQ